MVRRAASDALISALNKSLFWPNIIADPELQPEIRDEKITVYYQSSALIRELSLKDGSLVASVRDTYLPAVREGKYLTLRAGAAGLMLEPVPNVLHIGRADDKTINEYKIRVEADQGPESEGSIVQAICTKPGNMILDQEIAFQETGSDRDKIDLCCILPDKKTLAFVEVKRFVDERLAPKSGSAVREVVEQLNAYGSRILENKAHLVKTFRHVLALKQQLGLGDRYAGLEPAQISDLVEKPILVVGRCGREGVRKIVNGEDQWNGFIDAVRPVASALILCGDDGCVINLERGRNKKIF
jgi:hypothetical protein